MRETQNQTKPKTSSMLNGTSRGGTPGKCGRKKSFCLFSKNSQSHGSEHHKSITMILFAVGKCSIGKVEWTIRD